MSLVKEKFQDSTGDWIVRVFIDNDETHFFTFVLEPTEEQVEQAREKFLLIRESMKQELIENDDVLDELFYEFMEKDS